MLVNVNNIVKRGYKLSDCVLYKGKKYKIVAIDFALDYEDLMFLLNGYNSRSSNINFEEDSFSSFVLYDSDKTLNRKYSLWVGYDQISKVEDDKKYHSIGTKNKLYALYTGMVGGLFGEESFDRIVETNSYEDACNEARNICIKIYKAYEGRHGILDEKECEQEGLSYEDEIKNWISVSVIEVTSETINIILEEALSKPDIKLLKKYNFNYGDDTSENKEVNV